MSDEKKTEELRAEVVSAALTYAIAHDGSLAAWSLWSKQIPTNELMLATRETRGAAEAAHEALLTAVRALAAAGGKP